MWKISFETREWCTLLIDIAPSRCVAVVNDEKDLLRTVTVLPTESAGTYIEPESLMSDYDLIFHKGHENKNLHLSLFMNGNLNLSSASFQSLTKNYLTGLQFLYSSVNYLQTLEAFLDERLMF